jgi:HEAT repeat protein
MSSTEERLQHWLKTLNEPDANMSKIAAEKLGDLGDSRAVEPLIKTMQTRTPMIAAACALALGNLKDKRAVSHLISALKTSSDVHVQTAAAEALGIMKEVSAVPALKLTVEAYLKTYQNDRFNLIRGMNRGLFTTALQALRNIGTREAIRIADQAESAG